MFDLSSARVKNPVLSVTLTRFDRMSSISNNYNEHVPSCHDELTIIIKHGAYKTHIHSQAHKFKENPISHPRKDSSQQIC